MQNSNKQLSTANLAPALERLLAAAAADPDLREALLDDRIRAATDYGHQLSASEQAALAAVPCIQLQGILDQLGKLSGRELRRIQHRHQNEPAYAPTGIRPSK